MYFLSIAVLLAILSVGVPSNAQSLTDLTSSPIEDLLNLKITSVSKTQQELQRSAAAVFVITEEDIRRSGAANIPDLLRMVPGFDVAQINSNTWAISARGFNGRFSHVLLVMVDGRTVYAPTFGGVFWDILDVPLEDIQRIEVVRGPGGSIWGENAVNGVIDIITKKADATAGTLVEGRGSNHGASGILQYGGRAGAVTNYRTYANYLDEEELPALNGRPGGDGWHLLHGGFRMDTTLSSQDKVNDPRKPLPRRIWRHIRDTRLPEPRGDTFVAEFIRRVLAGRLGSQVLVGLQHHSPNLLRCLRARRPSDGKA